MKIEKTVDRGSKEKLYVQIYSIILEKIESGKWPPGTQIPSEDELCRIYNVSKVTVREAIQELVREGYLTRQQGKGTFVAYSVPHLGIVMRTRLSEDMYGEGVTIKKEILERGVKKPSEDIQTSLMTEDNIYYILCKKVVDGEPYIEESFIPLFIVPDIANKDILNSSLYDLIEENSAKKIFKVTQTIEATSVKEDTAIILEMKGGSPALIVSRILNSSDGSPIAYTRLIGSGKKSKVQMDFERIKL